MEELEDTSEEIFGLLTSYDKEVKESRLYEQNRAKWKQTCTTKERDIRKLMLNMKEEIDDLPKSTAATFMVTYRDHQKKLKQVSAEFQKKLKAPSSPQKLIRRQQSKSSTKEGQSNRQMQPDHLDNANTIESVFDRGDRQIARMRGAVTNMNAELQEGLQLAEAINLQLYRQIQQLDQIRDNVKDTGSTLKRAQKTINFFNKVAQCDRCILTLVIADLLCLITFIVLITQT